MRPPAVRVAIKRLSRALSLPTTINVSQIPLQVGNTHEYSHGDEQKTRFCRNGKLMAAVSFGFVSVALAKGKEKDRATVEKQEAEAIRQADILYEAYIIDNLYNLLNHYDTTNNVELLWRLARATCEKSKLCRNKNEKKVLMYEAWYHIKRCVTLDGADKNFAAQKWYAIILDYIGEYEGIKYRLQHSPEVKEHLLKATEINPTDATTWHILGLWHFAFADMPGYQRMVASAVFAQPPTATHEEALLYFEKAEKIEPNFYSMNHLYMAKCHLALGQKEQAKVLLQKAFDRGVVSADDMQVHMESDKLLKGLK